MRDNPLNVRVFGPDPEHRRKALTSMFAPVLGQYLGRGAVLGAFDAGGLVGVCGMLAPGRCQPSFAEKLRLLPGLLVAGGPISTARLAAWTAAWARLDPKTPHWHLVTVAADADRRGQGIGTAMLEAFCGRMEAARADAWLETDKPENTGFYRRFGFEVATEQSVLGIPNWFMARRAGG